MTWIILGTGAFEALCLFPGRTQDTVCNLENVKLLQNAQNSNGPGSFACSGCSLATPPYSWMIPATTTLSRSKPRRVCSLCEIMAMTNLRDRQCKLWQTRGSDLPWEPGSWTCRYSCLPPRHKPGHRPDVKLNGFRHTSKLVSLRSSSLLWKGILG